MEIKTEKKDNALIVSVSGMLDASNYQNLEEKVLAYIQDGDYFIIFNMKNLEYMSSAGVRVFIKTYRALTSHKGSMAFSCLQPFVVEIFEIAGLTSAFQIYQDDESAIRSLFPL